MAFVRVPAAIGPANQFGAYLTRFVLGTSCRVLFVGDRTIPTPTPVDVVGPRGRLVGEWVGQPRRGGQVLYFLHGSGYVGCSPWTHRGLVAELTRRLERPAFSLDYRLGPEHKFPAAHDDTLNGYLWLLDQGYASEDIIVVGDSAGGHLGIGLCGQLRALGLAQPRAVIGFSALVDPTWSLAAEKQPHVHDVFIGSARVGRRLTEMYTGRNNYEDPRLDVLSAIGPDLPPMLLQAGAEEILSGDAEGYTAALRAAGGDCDLQTWPGMFHVFQMAYRVLPEARDALNCVERFVARVESERTQRTA